MLLLNVFERAFNYAKYMKLPKKTLLDKDDVAVSQRGSFRVHRK